MKYIAAMFQTWGIAGVRNKMRNVCVSEFELWMWLLDLQTVFPQTDFWMAEVQNQQSRECKHKGEKGLRINVQSFWCRWAPESFPRQLLGKSSRLLRVPLSRQILGGEGAFGAAHISWTPLSPVSVLKKSIYKQKSFLTLLLSNTGGTGMWMQFYFSFSIPLK